MAIEQKTSTALIPNYSLYFEDLEGVSASDHQDERFSTDPVKQYLKDLRFITLLSHTEEIDLARAVEQGSAAKTKLLTNSLSYQLVSSEANETAILRKVQEELVLLPYIKVGSLATQKMVESNLKLVVSIAKRYTNRGLPLLDLIQEGNISLYKAVRGFNYKLGYKFSTYATWWIRQAIVRSLADRGKVVRLPTHFLEHKNRIFNATIELTQQLRRMPTPLQITFKLNEAWASNPNGSPPFTPLKVNRYLMAYKMEPISLDASVGEDEKASLSSLVVYEEEVCSIDRDVSNNCLKEDLTAIMKTILTSRELKIISLCYGLSKDGQQKNALTLQSVGESMNLTRERVRQIRNEALAKIKNSKRTASLLRTYLTK